MNFQYLGLLARALPQAKFIHCVRDPVSTCFSIFRLPFDRSQSYAHRLESLGQYYSHYWQLMQRWQSRFPERIHTLTYEQTVADLETQARSLLEFLHLDYEPGVLNFHQTERLVRTPSADQVRQNLYSHALCAWRAYEQELAPLRAQLNLDFPA